MGKSSEAEETVVPPSMTEEDRSRVHFEPETTDMVTVTRDRRPHGAVSGRQLTAVVRKSIAIQRRQRASNICQIIFPVLICACVPGWCVAG